MNHRPRPTVALFILVLTICATLAPAELGARRAHAAGGSINGVITVAATAQPLANADVRIWNARAESFMIKSDVRGRYAFTNLPDGLYWLKVTPPPNLDLAEEFYNDSHIPTKTNSIAIAGAPVTIDVALDALGGLSGQVSLTGDVPSGASVTVTALYADLLDRIDSVTRLELVAGSTVVDDRGHYVLPNLPPGRYIIEISNSHDLFVRSYHPQAWHIVTAAPIAIAPGEERAQDLAFTPAPRGVVSGRVRDASGAALDKIQVEIYRRDAYSYAGRRTTTTAADGSYRFGDLPLGVYIVHFYNPSANNHVWYNQVATREQAEAISLLDADTVDGIDAVFGAPFKALADISASSGSAYVNPDTGAVRVLMPAQQLSDITVVRKITCPGGRQPINPTVHVGGANVIPMTEQGDGSRIYRAVVPAALLRGAGDMPLNVSWSCTFGGNGEPDEVVLSWGPVICEIMLYDPSGIVTDAATGRPVPRAKVTLYNVPNWRPRSGPDDIEPDTCESNESKPANQRWSQPAPTDQGVVADPQSGLISPAINPQITAANGRYGWDVAEGCWYVVVEAPGYRSLVSPVVGVPPAVTDLDLGLAPLDTQPGSQRVYLPLALR